MQQLFLLIGELADFKIGSRETDWGRRTFRGSVWENEVWQHGFIDKDWKLTCEYKKILVNNNDEHNDAFELLEMWLDNKFKKHKNTNLNFVYERVKDEPIEEDIIDIETIVHMDKIIKVFEDIGMCLKRLSVKISSAGQGSIDNYIDRYDYDLQVVKQLKKEIKELKEKNSK